MAHDHHYGYLSQFALYADQERGRYPVWQSLDLEGFFPGSGIVFVTVTVLHLPQKYVAHQLLQG